MSRKCDSDKDSVYQCMHCDDPQTGHKAGGRQEEEELPGNQTATSRVQDICTRTIRSIQDVSSRAVSSIQALPNQVNGSSQAISSIQTITNEAVRGIRAIEIQIKESSKAGVCLAGGGKTRGGKTRGGRAGGRSHVSDRSEPGSRAVSSIQAITKQVIRGIRSIESQVKDSSQAQAAASSQEPQHSGGRGSSGDHQGAPSKPGGSSCCKMEDLKKLTCNAALGDLRSSKAHFVFVDVDVFNKKTSKDRMVPHRGEHQWSSRYVKLPTTQEASESAYRQERRSEVVTQLSGLSAAPSLKASQVEDAIMKYNPKYKGQWTFDALSEFMKNVPEQERQHYQQLLPKIAALALKLPELVTKAVPLLQRGHTRAITLSQVQISCLLANAFFCTFPHRNATNHNAEFSNYPSINFSSLFGGWSERKQEKLRALLHYFTAVTTTNPEGLVTFERRCLKEPPVWKSCKETLQKLHVTSDGNIETTGTGLLQVDFACSLIGGGVLSSGLVQEEILFLMNPELIVSRLFTEKLQDNECMLITGAQQFSCYSGYSDSFRWLSPHEDDLERDDWARLRRQILAIDAVNFRDRKDQYNMSMINRELNKAYCGFKKYEGEEHDVATGKWGCGAFKGDPQLKALIQLMAAAKASRGLAFFTFGDEKLKQELEDMHHLLVTERITVERLYGFLDSYCAEQKKKQPHVDVFEFIRKGVRGSRLARMKSKLWK